MGQHDPHGVLRHVLVGPEVQLEARPQDFVGDLADLALPGRAGIGDDDIDAAEGGADRVERGAHGFRVRYVAGNGEAALLEPGSDGAGHRTVAVEDRDGGAFGGKGACRSGPDATAATGDHHDLPGKRRIAGLAEFGLLQRPVLHVEQVGFGNRLVAADGFGIGDDAHGVHRQIGGNARGRHGAADAEQAEAGDQHHPRIGVERDLGRFAHAVVADEVFAVLGEIGFCGRARAVGEGCDRRVVRRRHDQRPGLRADGVIRRDHAALAVAADLGAIDIGADRRAGAEFEHHAFVVRRIEVVGRKRQ